MLSPVPALSMTLAVWLLEAGTLVGVGVAALRLLGRRELRAGQTFDAFWFGLSLAIFALQLWHFVAPVNGWATACVGGTGLLGLAWAGRRLLAEVAAVVANHKRLALVALAGSVWIADLALAPADASDSASYHVPVIRWNHDYPLVRGLGNVQHRFAFNNATLLLPPLLEVGPARGRSSHFFNSLFMVTLWTQMLFQGRGVFSADARRRARGAAALIVLVPLVGLAMSKEVCSPTTDAAPAILTIVIALRLLDVLIGAVTLDLAAFVALAACTAAIPCMKMSGAPFAACAAGLLLYCYARRTSWALLAAIWATFLVPWVITTTVLSGYPLYPSLKPAVDVDWRLTQPIALTAREAIRDWARDGKVVFVARALAKVGLRKPAASMLQGRTIAEAEINPTPSTGLRWVWPWMITAAVATPCDVPLPALIIATALVVGWRRRARHAARPAGEVPAGAVLAAAPAALAIVAWFLTAPEPRFGSHLFWIVASVLIALPFARHASSARAARRLCVAVVALALAQVAQRASQLVVLHHSSLASIFVVRPGPDHGFHPMPKAHFGEFVTRSGLTVYVPDTYDGWDGPMPWTPFPNANLKLRRPGDIAAGFAAPLP